VTRPGVRRSGGRRLGGLQTEFGIVLESLVRDVAGARGAVLIDGEGHAIDFANDADAIDALDLQIAGAQVSIELVLTAGFAERRGLGAPKVLVEGRTGCIMGSVVEPGVVVDEGLAMLVLVLRSRANLGAAWRRFDDAHGRLAALLA
jgi:hypothetical protein